MATPIYENRFVSSEGFAIAPTGATGLTAATNGDLICAFLAPHSDGGKRFQLWLSRLAANDHHWTPPFSLDHVPGPAEAAFTLFTSAYGTIWAMWPSGDTGGTPHLVARASAERGHSWHTPEAIAAQSGWQVRNRPAHARNGDIVLPIYDGRERSCHVIASDDESGSWVRRGPIPANEEASPFSLVAAKDGSLIAFGGPGSAEGKRLWRSVSRDGGLRWTDAQPLEITSAGGPLDCIRLESGALALAWNNGGETGGPLTLALSTDNGQTWPVKRRLETEQAATCPSLYGCADGRIHVVSVWNRARIGQTVVNEEWIRGSR